MPGLSVLWADDAAEFARHIENRARIRFVRAGAIAELTAFATGLARDVSAWEQGATVQVVIAMIPLVLHEASADGQHIVQFVMPAEMSLAQMPRPGESRGRLRLVSAHDAPLVRYSGFASAAKHDSRIAKLLADVGVAGLEPAGVPRCARFDPPWTPLFLRRKEGTLPVCTVG